MIALVHLLLGLAVGGLQAQSLRRVARGEASPLTLLLRLAMVAGVLVFAALGEQLLAAALGWALGLAASVAWLSWRWS